VADILVNIQSDEPLIEPQNIERAVRPFEEEPETVMSSLMCACPREDLDNPACVKVVCDLGGNALYFSRSTIPYSAGAGSVPAMQHIGLYAYRREFLLTLAGLEATPLEKAESLEQLRALEHGYRIRMVQVANAPLSIDTPDDLRRARDLIDRRQPLG
jgi:3-deoxy-manno-octulosonate cytidylyltransferase (CMP-KDO synthetase)